ncbi:MAG: hypothetical protein ACFB0G_24615 [Leptolyngbyaceae cyanobacterium]
MWTTLLVTMILFLIALRVFLAAHNQYEVVSAGLIALACVMIALGVAPLVLKLVLLLVILGIEQWLLHRPPAVKN